MPTVAFVSPKGGVGKTTAAFVLATQIARGTKVTIIDADPNRPLEKWQAGGNTPPNLTIVSDANEENIIEKIEAAAAETPFVIVDLEGSAAKIVVLAVSMSDLVIVPTQGSQLDAEQAGRALNVVRTQEKMARRRDPDFKLPHAILLTRTSVAIPTRTLTHIRKNLENMDIPVFRTQLHEREAFRAIFSFKVTLENLSSADVTNIDKAIINAENFAQEVIDTLRNGGVVETKAKEVA